MKNQLVFANRVQVALFKVELSGQISDGMWENTRPHDHWVYWCEAEVLYSESEKFQGRNFNCLKDNYNFAANGLLGVVGDRMLNIANMAENGYTVEQIDGFEDHSWDLIKKYAIQDRDSDSKNKYWLDKYLKMKKIYGSKEVFEEAKKGSYDMKKLRKELNEMKRIVRIKL